MNLEKIVAVSGAINGLFKVTANRKNGLIIEDLDTAKQKFASSRLNQFTPLETVGIYTDDGESTALKVVFKSMLEQLEDNPPIDIKASAEQLRDYFKDILPRHDEQRVYPRDIRRVIKWFTLLHEKGMLESVDMPAEKEEENTED
ncbi:MAG: DUF5606 domain-containing protein [Saprospiraceae bacterium]|nr:DUF5606 domain-containing protein [Saprospiraceae bacterium]